MTRSRRPPAPRAAATDATACHWPECGLLGDHPAPKSRGSLEEAGRAGPPHSRPHEFHWFCLEHAREYNKRWDFFSGMDGEAIDAYRKDALIGHRPTWKSESRAASSVPLHEKLESVLEQFLRGEDIPPRAAPPEIPAKEREALAVLNLGWPVTLTGVKTRYKQLVKQYHPDTNPQATAEDADMFKRISAAYQLLRKCELLR
jgi:hypothetical protein